MDPRGMTYTKARGKKKKKKRRKKKEKKIGVMKRGQVNGVLLNPFDVPQKKIQTFIEVEGRRGRPDRYTCPEKEVQTLEYRTKEPFEHKIKEPFELIGTFRWEA